MANGERSVSASEALDARVDEQLSALLDGELSDGEAAFLLRRLSSDAALAERWQRLCVCRDACAGVPLSADASFVSRVADALPESVGDEVLDDASLDAGSPTTRRRALPSSVAGLGFAAAVAAVVVLGVTQWGQWASSPVASGSFQSAQVDAPFSVAGSAPLLGVRPVSGRHSQGVSQGLYQGLGLGGVFSPVVEPVTLSFDQPVDEHWSQWADTPDVEAGLVVGGQP